MLHHFSRHFPLVLIIGAAWFVSLTPAAVPPDYKGTPYKGSPKEIPGRINFHDYDLGGSGVSFVQDDMAYNPISGGGTAGGRDNDGDKDHPSFVMTNHGPSPSDTFYAANAVFPHGTIYPSSDTSVSASDWYIGACHANNWFNVTVHVSKPGKYWISSIWAAMNTSIIYQILFIGTQYATGKDTVKTDTVKLDGYNSYHAWRKYGDFASIQLDSGVQVMKFYNESYHLNQDFLFFAADSGSFSTNALTHSAKAIESRSLSVVPGHNAVRVALPDAGPTRVSVFDCIGRETTRVADRCMPAGISTVKVDLSGLWPGIYFLGLEHNGQRSAAKLQIVK
jgi:hypothetical protein